jgi:hypothetical protein
MTTSPLEPAQTYLQLRDRLLQLNPVELNLSPSTNTPHVWGVLVETGYAVGIATLVSLADGTTSLYYSTGSGLLGSSDYAPLAEASRSLVVQAEKYLPHMSKSDDDLPLPAIGQVSFILLTYSGVVSIQAPEQDLASGGHVLSPLFMQSRLTLEKLRVLSDKKRP